MGSDSPPNSIQPSSSRRGISAVYITRLYKGKGQKEENKPVAHSSILVTDSDLGITP